MAGLLIIVGIYFLNRRTIHRKIDLNNQAVEETAVILRKIVAIAVPIIIGSEIMPIMTLIDTGLIMTRLQATGWSYAEAKSLYGLLSGFCNSLIAFPQVFTQAVAVSLVPAVAAAFKVKDSRGVQTNINLGYRVTMIMAFPCAFGIFSLAEPILLLLYPAQKASAVVCGSDAYDYGNQCGFPRHYTDFRRRTAIYRKAESARYKSGSRLCRKSNCYFYSGGHSRCKYQGCGNWDYAGVYRGAGTE